MSFIASAYQQAIFQFITNGNGNAVIDAVAGSGKSTTIVNALKLIPSDKSVLFLAFNKAIVEELKLKVGNLANVEIKTLHGLGSTVINRAIKTTLDDTKYRFEVINCIKSGLIKPDQKLEFEDMPEYQSNILRLVDLGRVYLAISFQEMYDIADKYQISILDNEVEIALELIQWGKKSIRKIDFCDMVYLPCVLGLKFTKYDYIFVDECQDLNTAQRTLVLNSLTPTGRFIAVGDPRQAIYGFAGADVESFNILKGLPNTISLPLSVSYRCASSIIDLAKSIVPQIEARQGAEIGIVDMDAKLEHIADGDMILCRLTAPLVQQCMSYIANGTKAYVKGRDIGVNLINLIKKTNRKDMNDVFVRFENEKYKILCKIVAKLGCSFEDARLETLFTSYNDKIRAIELIAKGLITSDEVIKRIEAIFKDSERSGICLSTIHKAKGLESNNVFILCPEKLLHKRAMRVEWTAQQEYNLVYVAYTRAKQKLGFITDFKDANED